MKNNCLLFIIWGLIKFLSGITYQICYSQPPKQAAFSFPLLGSSLALVIFNDKLSRCPSLCALFLEVRLNQSSGTL